MIKLLIFIGGLLMFMSGIHMMSTSLERLALRRLRRFLNVFTNTKIKAVCFGIIMTALLHSSSTLTILVIAFVSSGHMKLKNAIWMIMGANVGTTFSSGLFFIDLDLYVYILCFIGFLLCFYHQYAGKSVLGLSVLLIGLEVMSSSLMTLQNEDMIMALLSHVSHPFLLVVMGIVLCGVIQSSSACMAILLSFSKSGLISFFQGAYLMYGFDIGTCLDTSLASLTSNKEGRKTAIFHLLFNITGTFLFTFISLLTPFLYFFKNIFHYDTSVIFVLLHMTMNIITFILFLFIDKYVVYVLDKYVD